MRTSARIIRYVAVACFLFQSFQGQAQNRKDQIYVDNKGVMRWSKDRKELYGFGVNYTLPFAHEYRMVSRTGTSHEDAIRQDVYHMARLDLDFFRVHVFDTEISDTLGNLIDNEHLRLFDFLVHEMKDRGIRFIITPIAYWGNGWPERDQKTPGFAARYGKEACLTNPEAIHAQANYLDQFVQHVNPYTGIAYKDDPDIIGFEICNEPHHKGTSESVTAFINTMVSSIRKSGCQKPVFYNMSHSIELADAYLKADIQGGTFQWYPTNLVANHHIDGNFVPQVASYPIPFASDPRFGKMAKIIYEFDAADVGGNYLYPVMATTFRKTGMQLAAQFAYDAMCWAPWNTNYGTHFMNLAYAPSKAISLKIASAVFHQQPLYADPSPSLTVNYKEDLAQWISDSQFFYSNFTSSRPEHTESLREIAGCGSSPLVSYNGTGAYFLDKLANGIWRLELMPDAYWIDDPYSPASPYRQKAAVIHAIREMIIDLPDLGNDFTIEPINKGNSFVAHVENRRFNLIPGTYLIKSKNAAPVSRDISIKNIKISEFVAPSSNLTGTVLLNHTPVESSAGKPFIIEFDAISPSPVQKVWVIASNQSQWKTLDAVCNHGNSYRTEVPEEMTATGFLEYRLVIESLHDTTLFPGALKGSPFQWYNRSSQTYKIRFVSASSPMLIWDPETDWEYTFNTWNRDAVVIPTDPGNSALRLKCAELPKEDPINKNEPSYSFKYYFGDKIKGRSGELPFKKFLVFRILNNSLIDQPVEAGLVDQNGSVVSAKFTIQPGDTICRLPINSLKSGSYLILPRPFPDFLPLWGESAAVPFDLSKVEMLQFIVKPSEKPGADLLIEKIWLE